MSRYVEDFSALADAVKRGGLVEIGEAEILMEESLDLPSNLWLRGQGGKSVLLQAAPAQQMLVASGVWGITLSDFLIRGAGGRAPNGLGAIRLGPKGGGGVEQCAVERVSIEGVGCCGIVISSKSGICHVRSCRIFNAGEEGVYVNGTECSVVHSRISLCAEAGVKSGGTDCLVQGNHLIHNGQFGVLISPHGVRGLTTGNIVRGSGFEGLRVNDAIDHMLTNNYVTASGQADPKRKDIRVSGPGHLVAGNVGEVKREQA